MFSIEREGDSLSLFLRHLSVITRAVKDFSCTSLAFRTVHRWLADPDEIQVAHVYAEPQPKTSRFSSRFCTSRFSTMFGDARSYAIITISFISLFAIIHFGVSIGIIVNDRDYGDIFRPEIGLSAFNIVVSLLGMAVGVLGFICIFRPQPILSEFDSMDLGRVREMRVAKRSQMIENA